MCDAGFGLHFLAHWVRETGQFGLAEGIRRLTSEPAQRFRIPRRGRLQVGLPADLLLFDPLTVGISRPLPLGPSLARQADPNGDRIPTRGTHRHRVAGDCAATQSTVGAIGGGR